MFSSCSCSLWAYTVETVCHSFYSRPAHITCPSLACSFSDQFSPFAPQHPQPLISTEYIIVGGVTSGQGAIITRDRTHAADVWRLQMPTRWFILETNYDHWNAPPADDDRRDPANKLMNSTSSAQVDVAYLKKVLGTFPVLNAETTYTALMSAAYNSFTVMTQNA